MNRVVGIILIVVGVAIGLIAVAWGFTNEALTGSARILLLAIVLIVPVAPLVGGGIYLTIQGAGDTKKQVEAGQSRKLLNIVQSKGSVQIDDVALELQMPKDKVRDVIYNLVGLGVFSGYINWDKGTLYSSEASKLRDLKQCPNCGGEITLSGKGVAKCRFCGTEFFLS
ncbi:MAG: TFIIB-type zinc ribbon-containing protein [Aggregatilineales bacterium]